MQVESEKLIDKKLVELVKENGGLCLKLLTTHVTGLPDRLCLFPKGKILFVELKTTGKKPKKIQNLVHDRLRSLGFRVEVASSSKQIEKIIKEYEEQGEFSGKN